MTVSLFTTLAYSGRTIRSNNVHQSIRRNGKGIGRKLALLISKKVEPFVLLLTICSCAHSASEVKNRLEMPADRLHRDESLIDSYWNFSYGQITQSGRATDKSTVPIGNSPDVICERPSSVTWRSVV